MKRFPCPIAVVATLVLLVLPALAQEAPRSPTPKDSKLPARQVDIARLRASVGLDNPRGRIIRLEPGA
jgi:hypothetical protein